MNDPEKTDVGNDPKTCIRAYHLVDDVGVIEHSPDQVSFDQPLEDTIAVGLCETSLLFD